VANVDYVIEPAVVGTSIIPAHRRLRQDGEFKVSLDYIAKSSQ
jgi:hypothetical protein